MKQTLQKALDRIDKAKKSGRIDHALAELDQLMQDWPDNPPLLLLRAKLIQLGSETVPPLQEAEDCLRRATELQSDSPNAWLELAHFQLNVNDDAKTAAQSFAKAISLCEELLMDALAGKAKALAELNQREGALACLAEAYWVQSHGNGKASTNGANLLQSLEELRLGE